MEIAIMIGMAVVELLLTYAMTDQQQRQAEARSAHEVRVRSLFQAVRDRFGLAYNQLDQLLSNMDLRLSQLIDATRGSSRLSKASQILRQFIDEYPGSRNKINDAKNKITNSMNNLTSMESSKASQIQNRKDVSDLDVLGDVVPEINEINTTLSDVNNDTSKQTGNSTNMNIELTEQDKESLKPKSNGNSGRGYPTPRLPIPGTV